MKLSVRFSFTFRSAAMRWSHGANWRSPANLRAQIRIVTPLIEKFEQKFASMASVDSHKGILTNLAKPGDGKYRTLYSFSALNNPRIDKLPYSIRILLESAIRNRDSFQVTKNDIEKIIDWENTSYKQVENPCKPAHILLKDFTGIPATVDLAAMRDALKNLGNDPNKINPLLIISPVDLALVRSLVPNL